MRHWVVKAGKVHLPNRIWCKHFQWTGGCWNSPLFTSRRQTTIITGFCYLLRYTWIRMPIILNANKNTVTVRMNTTNRLLRYLITLCTNLSVILINDLTSKLWLSGSIKINDSIGKEKQRTQPICVVYENKVFILRVLWTRCVKSIEHVMEGRVFPSVGSWIFLFIPALKPLRNFLKLVLIILTEQISCKIIILNSIIH